jgi:hypothetical protein
MSASFREALRSIIAKHINQTARLEIAQLAGEMKRRERVSPGRSADREAVGVPPDVSARPGEP